MKTDRWLVCTLHSNGHFDCLSHSSRERARSAMKFCKEHLGMVTLLVDTHKEFLKPLGHIINTLKNKRRRLQHETN